MAKGFGNISNLMLENRIERMEEDVDTKVSVMTSTVTKSVASESSINPEDFDFANLVEAVLFCGTVSIMVSLSLDDGIHYTKGDGYYGASISINKLIAISSISQNKDACFIKPHPDYLDDRLDAGMFNCTGGGVLKLRNITFDGSDLTSPYCSCITLSFGSSINLYKVGFKNIGRGIHCYEGTKVLDIDNTYFENINDCYFVQNSDITIFSKGNFINCSNLVYDYAVDALCQFVLEDGYSTSGITNISSDGVIPINKINERGNFIFTENRIWTGTTATRPSLTVADERSYFDTDLGIPVWYTGSVWVDAVGVTV